MPDIPTTRLPNSAALGQGLFALLALFMAYLRVTKAPLFMRHIDATRIDEITLLLLAAPLVLLLFNQLSTVKIGKDGVELTRLKEAVEVVSAKLDATQATVATAASAVQQSSNSLDATRAQLSLAHEAVTASGLAAADTREVLAKTTDQIARVNTSLRAAQAAAFAPHRPQRPTREQESVAVASALGRAADAALGDVEDPHKGRWGGKRRDQHREVVGQASAVPGTTEWFLVTLTVRSTQADDPLSGAVRFHLHPTFPNDTVDVAVVDGIAQIERLAYGAFTVGVETDAGARRLELDLAELQDAPWAFRQR